MPVMVLFDLEDFKELAYGRGALGDIAKELTARSVSRKPLGEAFSRYRYVVHAPYLVYGADDTARVAFVLRCVVSERTFHNYFVRDPESEEGKEYERWLEECRERVVEELGFEPREGYWE